MITEGLKVKVAIPINTVTVTVTVTTIIIMTEHQNARNLLALRCKDMKFGHGNLLVTNLYIFSHKMHKTDAAKCACHQSCEDYHQIPDTCTYIMWHLSHTS